MKVIIAGGRNFANYTLLCEKCDKFLINQGDSVEIVSGGQRTKGENGEDDYGADYLGEIYAERARKCKLTIFPADWDKYGKAAGSIRNKEMAEYADSLIAFWDGKSKGTKNMIDLAIAHGLSVRVITYNHRNRKDC